MQQRKDQMTFFHLSYDIFANISLYRFCKKNAKAPVCDIITNSVDIDIVIFCLDCNSALGHTIDAVINCPSHLKTLFVLFVAFY